MLYSGFNTLPRSVFWLAGFNGRSDNTDVIQLKTGDTFEIDNSMINRSAVVVRVKQPYITWAGSLDDSGILPSEKGEPSMYLMPEIDNESHAWELLEHAHDTIFECELEAWHRERDNWPQNRSFTMFRLWFDITFVSLIEDLCEGPIINDG